LAEKHPDARVAVLERSINTISHQKAGADVIDIKVFASVGFTAVAASHINHKTGRKQAVNFIIRY
jgi:hypothetical protein